ncbi:hypothetical protein ColLi_12694 [Colletotrichum liriopes]|uniref:Ubiquitin-like protease family profile domain-containing protein n=1 Tax=Colletotrichum liriopes TaxID=708192 RepID=A0AA37H0R3_9PEZI|nr:hypothetical protein ColLi_12694 [Colletotrichum liriopes]
MDCWSAEVNDFIRSCSEACAKEQNDSRSVARRFFDIESRATADGQVDRLDLRAKLPRSVASYVVRGCDPDSLKHPDWTCLPKLRKACDAWDIDSSLCLFLFCVRIRTLYTRLFAVERAIAAPRANRYLASTRPPRVWSPPTYWDWWTSFVQRCLRPAPGLDASPEPSRIQPSAVGKTDADDSLVHTTAESPNLDSQLGASLNAESFDISHHDHESGDSIGHVVERLEQDSGEPCHSSDRPTRSISDHDIDSVAPLEPRHHHLSTIDEVTELDDDSDQRTEGSRYSSGADYSAVEEARRQQVYITSLPSAQILTHFVQIPELEDSFPTLDTVFALQDDNLSDLDNIFDTVPLEYNDELADPDETSNLHCTGSSGLPQQPTGGSTPTRPLAPGTLVTPNIDTVQTTSALEMAQAVQEDGVASGGFKLSKVTLEPEQPRPLGMHVEISRKRKERAMPSPEASSSKRRNTFSIDEDPLDSLVPGSCVIGSVMSATLYGLSDLLPHSTLVAKCTAQELAHSHGRTALKLNEMLRLAAAHVKILLPFNSCNHWSLAVATARADDTDVTIEMYDSISSNARAVRSLQSEAQSRVAHLLKVRSRSSAPIPPALPPSSRCSLRQSIQQTNDTDCGVAVAVHAFYDLSQVLLPLETDFLLWRRLLAAFLAARTDSNRPSSALGTIRAAHQKSMGIKSKPAIVIQIPKTLRDLCASNPLSELAKLEYSRAKECSAGLVELLHSIESSQKATDEMLKTNQATTQAAVHDARKILRQLWAMTDTTPSSVEALVRKLANVGKALREVADDEDTAALLRKRIETIESELTVERDRVTRDNNRRLLGITGLRALEGELGLVEQELVALRPGDEQQGLRL